LRPRPPLVSWRDLETLACEAKCAVETTVHADTSVRLLADAKHSHEMLELVHDYAERDAKTIANPSTSEQAPKRAANWRALATAIEAENTLNVRVIARRYRAQFVDYLEHGLEAADGGRAHSADADERDAWRALTRAGPQCVDEVSETLSERHRPLLVARLLYQAAIDGDAVVQCGRCTVIKCYRCLVGDKTTKADVSRTRIHSQSFAALLMTPTAAAAVSPAAPNSAENRLVGGGGGAAVSSQSATTAPRVPLRVPMTAREVAANAFHVVVADALGTIVAKSACDPVLLTTIERVVQAYVAKTLPKTAAALCSQNDPWLRILIDSRQLELAAANGNLALLKRMHAAESICAQPGAVDRLWEVTLRERQVPVVAWLACEALDIEPFAPAAAAPSSLPAP
jgi:hypothetical protein